MPNTNNPTPIQKLSSFLPKQDRLWLWFPILAENLSDVQTQGLKNPFLFGKKRSAAALRLPKDRIILRVARYKLDEGKLIRDFSLRQAQNHCQTGCRGPSMLRMWLNSFPLKDEDILTRWACSNGFESPQEMDITIKQLGKLDSHGFWHYEGNVEPGWLSIISDDGKFYQSLKDRK